MRARSLILALLAAALLLWPQVEAQVDPLYDRGAAGLMSAIGRLSTTASALHTGAHPDDEDSGFIARTARGDHARVAYLSLNRGEGGQNIIGPELFEALGVIRTEELLQARRLDGGEQFFTRAFDFGFSKTREETAALWNEAEVLRDMVRVIRSFRPLVIYSRFSGTSADGHGHHQMAGYLTPLAFEAAADPTRFPELAREGLPPWQARKLYRGTGRGGGPGGGALSLPTGIVAPIIGRSYAEIAAEGRSQHKSQGMGTIEPLGPASTSLVIVRSLVDAAEPGASIFDGIDVTVPGLAALAGLPADALRTELAAMHDAASRAIGAYEPLAPERVIPALVDGLRATRAARAVVLTLSPADAVAHADWLLARKEEEYGAALVLAAGVVVDPLADEETVAQGGTIDVIVRTFLTGGADVRVAAATVRAPEGWTVQPVADGGGRGAGAAAFRREQPALSAAYQVRVPADAPPTRPYYLAVPRSGEMYVWPDAAARGLPFDATPLSAVVTLDIGGVEVTVERPVQFRYADAVRGELRRDVSVVPPLAVGLDSPLLIVPTGAIPHAERLVVRARSFSDQPTRATVRLEVPEGWTVEPSSAAIAFEGGATQSVPFTVTAPPNRRPGSQRIAVVATADEGTFTQDIQVVAYPHIQTHRLYAPAAGTARVFDLDVAPVRVGYIMGSGDQVPDALRRMGVEVTMLDDETIATGDLSGFDTIVVGIRAAEARPAFVAHHGRLQQFMERGGALIVQYQQQYASQGLLPYPAQAAGNSRVTDERAPVTILAPEHPVFAFPNRITAADFDGWVQERNLYALTAFDDRYTPLLESADAGEPPQRGGALHARVGQGHYVYTAYAWFRQLPAGVPGAYRQFANLISLPRAP